jgi:hypothetical protein
MTTGRTLTSTGHCSCCLTIDSLISTVDIKNTNAQTATGMLRVISTSTVIVICTGNLHTLKARYSDCGHRFVYLARSLQFSFLH